MRTRKRRKLDVAFRLWTWGRPSSVVEPANFYSAGQRAKLQEMKGLDR